MGFSLPVPTRPEREFAKRAIEEQVQKENLEESIRNLLLLQPSVYHSHLLNRGLDLDHMGAAFLIKELRKDPRFIKVSSAAEHGTGAERRTILKEITAALEHMISGPAVTPMESGRILPSVTMPNGGLGYPLLLLDVDERAESLPLLIRVADFIQAIEHRPTTPEYVAEHKDLFPGGFVPPPLPWYVHTDLGDTAAFAVRHMLDWYCDDPEMQATLTARQRQQLEVYRGYRDRVRAEMRTKRDEDVKQLGGYAVAMLHLVEQSDARYWDLGQRTASKPEGTAYAKMDAEKLVLELARAVVADK